MKSAIIWCQLGLVIGLLVHWSHGKPLDADSLKENMGMAAMNAAGIAMEMVQNVKAHGGINSGFAIGGTQPDSSEEDRRRRRSIDDADPASLQPRQKRSPCFRRRRMQTTQAPPAATTAAAGGDDDDDLPRRRRRSPDENDIDENVEVIPKPRAFNENAQEIHERIKQAVKTALDTMTGILEAVGKRIRTAFDESSKDPDAM